MEFSETEVITGDLISRFEKVVQRFPEKIALKSPRSELTFLELDNWSNGIALKLLERQKPGDRVGLLFSHGVKSMVAQVAALKGGFTRTELNVSYPGARLREIIQHCQIRCILSRTEFRDLAEELASEQGISILYVDEAEPSALQKPGVVLAPRTPSSISFSSGSTGKPKLKEKNHLIELHSVMRVSQSIGLLPQDRMLFTRSATVIPFHALLTGACYYPADIQREGDLVDLVNWVRDEQITILRSPVSIFRAMMHTIPEGETLPSLSRIVLQGEPVYRADVEAYRKRFNEQCVMVSTLGVS
ncbi:MAG: AMP-binding protein, partial [Verrucomicrobiae bacterium]|nr:AMP-binding protein [Verrucomicrobiae bacterium]